MSTITEIQQFIETKIRPELQDHGGDIEFVDFEDGLVKVKLYGACAHCPSSLMHMHGDVEGALKEQFPDLEGIEIAD